MKILTVVLLLLTPHLALAYGPRSIATSGDVVTWQMPVDVDLETDTSVRGKDVGALVEEALQIWEDVPEAAVSITRGSLGADVDQENACEYLFSQTGCPDGPTGDGLNPLVIDEDGEIVEMFFGTLNKFAILGFATILIYDDSTGDAQKGEAVFNASCLQGIALPGCTTLACPAFEDDDFVSFVVHEIGHFLGLNHSQVNLDEAEDDDSSNDTVITTMYPLFSCGSGSYFKTPERDDRAGIASLYPAADFATTTWTLTGTVYDEDGTTEFQCANVIARNDADPRVDALSFVSGQLAQPNSFDGSFVIEGLDPDATYSLEVEPIFEEFTASSGLAPCTGSSGEPLPPSFDSQTLDIAFSGEAGGAVENAIFTLTNTEENVGSDDSSDDDSSDDSDDSDDSADSDDSDGSASDSAGCSLIPR